MAKIISVADDVYKELKERKGEHSYSEVIRELLRSKGNRDSILAFAGKGGIDEEKVKEARRLMNAWKPRYA